MSVAQMSNPPLFINPFQAIMYSKPCKPMSDNINDFCFSNIFKNSGFLFQSFET